MHSFLDEMNFWIIPLKPMVLQISAFCTDKFYYKYLTQAPLIGTKYKSISSVHKKKYSLSSFKCKSFICYPTYLNYRHLASKHEHNTHLKKNSKSIPNIICIEFLEALSAIPALK